MSKKTESDVAGVDDVMSVIFEACGYPKGFVSTVKEPDKPRKKKKSANFNKAAKSFLHNLGYVTEIVEHYNAFSGRKNDFCGFADAIALNPDVLSERILAVQITSINNISSRFNKITQDTVTDGEEKPNPVPDKARLWLRSGGGIWIIGFDSKEKTKVKVRRIELSNKGDFTTTEWKSTLLA
jgi:hypothetical protein